MNDKEETTRKFDDQPEWVRYLISRADGLTKTVDGLTTEGQEALRKGQEDLREGQQALREEFNQFREEVRVEFRRLNAKILDVLQRHLDVVADISELNRRVSALEAPNN